MLLMAVVYFAVVYRAAVFLAVSYLAVHPLSKKLRVALQWMMVLRTVLRRVVVLQLLQLGKNKKVTAMQHSKLFYKILAS